MILVMRGLRQLAYGELSVILGVALANEGFSPLAIGILITVSLVGDMAGTLLIGIITDVWGRLALLALFMAGTGVAFGFIHNYPVFLIAAFFGTLGTTASETAPFLPIDQAMLAQVSQPEQRIAVFAQYNLIASLSTAVGALIAGTPDALTHIGLPLAAGIRLLFGVYALLALSVVGLSQLLSAEVEATLHPSSSQPATRFRLLPTLSRSRGMVWRLTALFSVDALAEGLVVQSLMVLFFHLRFGIALSLLATLFFGANLLSALSFLAAVSLARRFGLLNTMVFTHLPSNVLLALIAFAPTFPLAALLLLVRQLLSQMDVPTRQAYTMALVSPSERTAAASLTSVARSVGSSTSPVVAGLLLQSSLLLLGIPFILVGTLKAAYDLILWFLFRRVSLEEGNIPQNPTQRQSRISSQP
ncbi:MAG TPA: MFS transporter [Ktedonobacteraceae bacterium]|nr:MFS transporter [Ktedonobacteraceae bacterium]